MAAVPPARCAAPSHCSAWSSSAFTALPIRLTVVSKPATSSSTHIGSISSGCTWSPSAATTWLTMSSAGSRRRSSNSSLNSTVNSLFAPWRREAWDSDLMPSIAPPMTVAKRAKRSASASGDAEQVGNDRDRQGRRQCGYQVELTRRFGAVEQVADPVLDAPPVARRLLGAERRLGEPAQPGVIRWVHVEERQVEVAGGRIGLRAARRAYARAPVTQHQVADAVAGGHPVAHPRGRVWRSCPTAAVLPDNGITIAVRPTRARTSRRPDRVRRAAPDVRSRPTRPRHRPASRTSGAARSRRRPAAARRGPARV